MGWMKELSDTYDNCSHMVGVEDETGNILLPVAHSTQNAQVEVVIDLKGNFIKAEEIPKDEAVTIIPVTEDSGSRSSGIAPHPLCDKLIYVAGDFAKYSSKKNANEYYERYLSELEKWCSSKHSNNFIQAVYEYVKKRSLIKDLIEWGIICLNKDNYIDEKKKVQNITATDLFVRFRISDFDLNNDVAIWKEHRIYQSYIDYVLSKQEKVDLCYVSGELVPCSYKHPAKVRHAADKAKLISANDEYGFTYRGRFTEKEQAFSVGYLTSQKAHNTLRWLMERQGYTHYGISLVVWEKNDVKLPVILDGTREMLQKMELIAKDSDLGYSYAKNIRQAIDSYKGLSDTKATVHIISVDAATTGRLAVNYYRVLNYSDFYDRLVNWHTTCIWKQEYRKADNTKGYYVGAPSVENIVLAAYGTEQNGKLTIKDELKKVTIERLLPCILDKRAIPKDIVRAAIQNASRPMAMNRWNWTRVLNTTCALIKKDLNYEVEDWNMALDANESDRSYLYGRLLAVADHVEYLTFDKDEMRPTNAKRYMQQFHNRPFTTWTIIEKNLRPYFIKLKYNGQRKKYEDMLNDIYDLFDRSQFRNNSPLDGMFLLGFHCQLKAFDKKDSINNDNNEEVDENE